MGYGEIWVVILTAMCACWEMVVAASQDWAFVCEDDIQFACTPPEFLQSPYRRPMMRICSMAETVFQRVLMDKRPAVLGLRPWPVPASLRPWRHRSGNVSRRGAQKLLNLTSAACDPVDQLMFNPRLGIAGKLAIWQLEPAICVQDYLVTASDRHSGVESVVNAAPRLFHPEGGRSAKPKGFERRVLAPLRKLGKLAERLLTNTLTRRRFRKVPVEIDGVRFVAAGKAGNS